MAQIVLPFAIFEQKPQEQGNSPFSCEPFTDEKIVFKISFWVPRKDPFSLCPSINRVITEEWKVFFSFWMLLLRLESHENYVSRNNDHAIISYHRLMRI